MQKYVQDQLTNWRSLAGQFSGHEVSYYIRRQPVERAGALADEAFAAWERAGGTGAYAGNPVPSSEAVA